MRSNVGRGLDRCSSQCSQFRSRAVSNGPASCHQCEIRPDVDHIAVPVVRGAPSTHPRDPVTAARRRPDIARRCRSNPRARAVGNSTAPRAVGSIPRYKWDEKNHPDCEAVRCRSSPGLTRASADTAVSDPPFPPYPFRPIPSAPSLPPYPFRRIPSAVSLPPDPFRPIPSAPSLPPHPFRPIPSAPSRPSRVNPIDHPRKRNHFPDVRPPRNPRHRPLQPQPEPRMRKRPVLP